MLFGVYSLDEYLITVVGLVEMESLLKFLEYFFCLKLLIKSSWNFPHSSIGKLRTD